MAKSKKEKAVWSKRNIFMGMIVLMVIIFFTASKYSGIFLQEEGKSFTLPFSSLDLFFSILFFSIACALDKVFKLDLEPRHYVYLGIICILSFVLIPLYTVYFYYDKFLHFTESILISSIVFHMVKKLKIEIKWTLLLTIFIMIGLGSLFEITEFGLDQFFKLDTQGVSLNTLKGAVGKLKLALDPLTDTNLDMLYNLLGAVSYSIFFVAMYLFKGNKKANIKNILRSKK